MKTIVLQLDPSRLQHIAPDNVRAIDKTLDPVRVTNDQRLATLMSIMCDEVREGCPSGRLFAESISLALLAYLACRYATVQHADQHRTSLSLSQKRVLIDYIRSNLTSDISVTELAGLMQMSPSHFARIFKAEYGVAPYRFIMQERIEGAKEMLESTKLSASQISSAYGFSSQSHFTKVFRQFLGMSPTQYKRAL